MEASEKLDGRLESELKAKFIEHNLQYNGVETNESLKKLHDLWVNDVHVEPENAVEYDYFADYYWKIKGNKDRMMLYYLKAIELGRVDAMAGLGGWYESQNDFTNALKYYRMAADKNDAFALCSIGVVHKKLGNIDAAIESLEKALMMNDTDAAFFLGDIYAKIDAVISIKYFTIGAEMGDIVCIEALIGKISSGKLLALAIKHKNKAKINQTFSHFIQDNEKITDEIINELLQCNDNILPQFLLAYKQLLTSKFDILGHAFKYAPTQSGFEEAKNDYIEVLTHPERFIT